MTIIISNSTNVDQENIKTLSKRERGDVYFSDNGYLKKMSFIQKIFLKLSKIFNIFKNTTYDYLQNKSAVKVIIDDLVSRVEGGDENEFKDFFFERISPFPEDIYDRTKINKVALKILRKSLESSLDVQKIIESVEELKKPPVKPEDKSFDVEIDNLIKRINLENFQDIIIEAKLSTNLGVRAKKPKGGYSKTYFIKDINHDIIGVFKPGSSDSLSTNAPFRPMRLLNRMKHFENVVVNAIRKRAIVKQPINTYMAGKCHLAEEMSYRLARSMKIDLVPPTKVVSINPIKNKRKFSWKKFAWLKTQEQVGSFQLFVGGTKPANEFFNLIKKTYIPKGSDIYDKEMSDELDDQVKIHDKTSGNFDKHSENLLIVPDENDPNKVKNVVSIDGGQAFAPKHPNSDRPIVGEVKKQYYWATKDFPWSQKKFTPYGKSVIKDSFNRRLELSKEVYDFYVSEGEDEEVSKERANRVVDRLEVLYYVAIIKDEEKYKLKNYRTLRAIQEVKREMKSIGVI